MLHRSQSAVSHRLQQLEEELGIQLITRQKGHKNVVLTAQGEDFISIAERFLLLDEEAQMAKHKVLRTRLSVGGVDSLNHFFFADFFAGLCAKEPSIEVQIRSNHGKELYDMLQAQVIDVGIVNNDAFRLDIVPELLFSEPFVVVGTFPGHASGNGGRIHPSTLDPAQGILNPYTPSFQQWQHYWFGGGEFLTKVDTLAMAEPFLRGSMYWSIMPYSVACVVAKRISCSWRYLEEAPPERTAYLITHKYRKPYNADALEKFIFLIRQHVSATIPAKARV